MRSLENDGLVVVERSQADGRVHTAHLTDRGRAERVVLDQRSDDAAVSMLGPLSPQQRTRMVKAMAEVERLLAAAAIEVAVRDPRDPDARSCLRAYFSELGRRFDGGFDPALSISADDKELIPPEGLLLVATLHSEPAGCGALKFHDGAPAEIKRMWVAPAVRGLGLGRRLLAELEAHAAANQASVLRLETNRTLDEAIGLYQSAGYREVTGVQRRALRASLVREKTGVALGIQLTPFRNRQHSDLGICLACACAKWSGHRCRASGRE